MHGVKKKTKLMACCYFYENVKFMPIEDRDLSTKYANIPINNLILRENIFRIEDATDRRHQFEKLQRVRNAYRETATAASEACPISARNPNFRPHIYASLSK